MRLFHITTRTAWQEAVRDGVYRAASLSNEGFIHLSTERQWLGVARRLFARQRDLVLLALGFSGPDRHDGLVDQLGLGLDPRGTITRGPDFATNVPGVYAAGDAARGQSLIVWAIAEGRAVAAAVDRGLTGADRLPSPIGPYDRPMTA